MRRGLVPLALAAAWLAAFTTCGCTPEGQLTPPAGDDDDHGPPAPTEQVPGVGDLSAALFDGDGIVELRLTVGEQAWAVLEAESIEELENDPAEVVDFSYVEGTLEVDGETLGPIGVRLKSQGSFRPVWEKAAFKLDIDRFVDGLELAGLERLTLNNMASDPSMLRERLGYHALRELGRPASRCDYARLWVNDVYYGVYANVESVDRRMIRRWFDDDQGSLFEIWDSDFYPGWTDLFQLEFGPDDRTNLEGLADALQLEPSAAAMEAAADHVDVAGFVEFWAGIAVIAHVDGYPYHYDDVHVYDDPASGVLWFLPWGADECFNPSLTVIDIAGLLAVRCGGDEACVESWVHQVLDDLDALEAMDLPAMLDAEAARIAPHVAEETMLPYEGGLDAVAPNQQWLRQFIVDRRETIYAEFGFGGAAR